MKRQTAIGKAFEINKNPLIYGTFAEIGAGQETVNFFYKAGLASQTVAKSMSAYDMTFSDEIYGKQSRYVSHERLSAMLDHEYKLLQRRLKRNLGAKSCFFAFAVTAASSARAKNSPLSNSQRAWMGLRFQARPLQAFNNIAFYVNCLDKGRLQQHEALGILGVNLIYAGFHYKSHLKKLISSLTENLSGGRIEIHGMSCSGPAFKNLSAPAINREILSQSLSPFAFFPKASASAFLTDAVFGKSLVISYKDQKTAALFRQKKAQIFKALSLTEKSAAPVSFIPKQNLKAEGLKNQLQKLCQNNVSVLTADNLSLEGLKGLLSPYSAQPMAFVLGEEALKRLFSSGPAKDKPLLKSLGALFDNKTKVIALANKNSAPNRKKSPPDRQTQILKDYLIERKQILRL